MINLGKITRDVHLKHKITHTEFKIPPLAAMDLNRKHFDDERAPMDSVLNFLATNADQLTNEDTTSTGGQIDSVTTKVKAQVQSWVETDLWIPIRKYVIIIIGSIIALTKPCKTWSSNRIKEREAPQIYIMRKDRTKPASSTPSDQTESLV